MQNVTTQAGTSVSWESLLVLLANDQPSEFETAIQQIEQIGIGSESVELTSGAGLLANLLRLSQSSIESGDDSLAKQFWDFVGEHSVTLRDFANQDVEAKHVLEFISQAKDQWADYLEYFDSIEVESCDQDLVAADEPSDSGEQINLLLNALGTNLQDDSIAEAGTAGETHDQTTPDEFVESAANQGFEADFLDDEILRQAYLDDANQCLASMEQAAMSVESETDTAYFVQDFCRDLHTLKGASASVGLSEFASYLHQVESTLSQIDDDENPADQMLETVDRIRDQVQSLQHSRPNNSGPTPTETNISLNAASNELAATGESLIRIRASKLDRLMDMLAELVVLRNRRESSLLEFTQLNEELMRCVARLKLAEQMEYEARSEMDDYSGMITRGSRTCAEIAKDITVVSKELRRLQKPVAQDTQAISRFIRHFRQELMQVLRLPVSGLFNRLKRSTRDAAKVEGKKVKVQTIGETSGLEMELQEKLYEPLLHIVRNAVGHGIENEADRVKAGKSGIGAITLEAQSNSQMLVVEVRDDGKGLDDQAIRSRAIEKGLLQPNQHVSQQEIWKLIFHPGFSTRQQANELAGRGVGMDVVSTVMEQLRGRIDIESRPNEGTTIRLTIPLRSGIEHVMVFRASGQLFAFPMQAVTAVKNRNHKLSSVLAASALLSLPSHSKRRENSGEVLLLKQPQSRANNSVQAQLGLEVDEIVGPEEVVVRGLPSVLKHNPLFRSLTLSGAGETMLLLDSNRLIDFYLEFHMDTDQPMPTVNWANEQRNVLVLDDSLSARKVLAKKLSKLGFNVTEASDGIEGLERTRTHQFHAIFTDLDMPRLGGLEFMADLQQSSNETPVIVVSSRDKAQFHAKAQEYGAAEFISKPVADRELNESLLRLNLLETN